ncbi:MAG TPA: M48 family metallopeptidase [Polyangia bacterium]
MRAAERSRSPSSPPARSASSRCAPASSRPVDYVVVHELVHLLHGNHTPRFWSEVGRSIPDYEAVRERLRALGPSLIW